MGNSCSSMFSNEPEEWEILFTGFQHGGDFQKRLKKMFFDHNLVSFDFFRCDLSLYFGWL
jgi:hypothetical protein